MRVDASSFVCSCMNSIASSSFSCVIKSDQTESNQTKLNRIKTSSSHYGSHVQSPTLQISNVNAITPNKPSVVPNCPKSVSNWHQFWPRVMQYRSVLLCSLRVSFARLAMVVRNCARGLVERCSGLLLLWFLALRFPIYRPVCPSCAPDS